MGNAVPANQHWVPQCYLRRFARNDSKKSQLWVADAAKGVFQTTPRNVAARRYFNRINLEGFDPDSIEVAYGKFENEVGPALQRTDEAKCFVGDSDRNLILNLVALLTVRNPRLREQVRRHREAGIKLAVEATLATRGRYETAVRSARSSGHLGESEGITVTYDQVRQYFASNEITVPMESTEHVRREVLTHEPVRACLAARNWTMFIAPEGSGGFLTSDHPICLVWQKAGMESAIYPPGHGMKRTDVWVPLSKGLAMRGRFEAAPDRIDATPELVAGINGILAFFAERQVYASGPALRSLCGDGFIGDFDALAKDLKERLRARQLRRREE